MDSLRQHPKRKKLYVKPGQPEASTSKPNIHGNALYLVDQKGVIYYELLKPGRTITGDFYRQQLFRLKRAIAEKRPEYATRHESIIFHHDNARPHVPVLKTIWKIADGKFWLTRLIALAPSTIICFDRCRAL